MKFDINVDESAYPIRGRNLFRKWKKKALTPVAERFWAKVDKCGPDECWPWKAGKDGMGYGRFQVFGEPWSRIASRFAWELVNGPIPNGLDILHSCDNPPCCNPKHLRPGTASDNIKDSVARGRFGSPGEASKKNKLTQAQVDLIRRTFSVATGNIQEIARAHKVSDSCIADILKGRTWKCSKIPIPNDSKELQRQRQLNGIRRGSSCSRAKLKEQDISVIRQLHSIGAEASAIAACMGVTPCTISNIIRGVTWKHI